MTEAGLNNNTAAPGDQAAPGADADDGMDVLLPNREVQLEQGDEVVEVRPVTFIQLPKGARHIDGVIRAALRAGMITEQGEINVSGIASMYAEAGEHVNELILMCAHIDDQPVDRDWLSKVSIEEGLDLAMAVIQVNWRASIVKKLEALSGEMEELGQLLLDRLGDPGPASSSG